MTLRTNYVGMSCKQTQFSNFETCSQNLTVNRNRLHEIRDKSPTQFTISYACYMMTLSVDKVLEIMLNRSNHYGKAPY